MKWNLSQHKLGNVYCWKCNKLFSVDYEEYHSVREEVTFMVIRCPFCKTPNSISYSTSVFFRAYEPAPEDLVEFEDETYVGEEPVK